MSNVFRRLRNGVRELKGLYDDVHDLVFDPDFEREDWQRTTFAPRTLGEGIPVELWYLAEHFLLAWNDWHGLRDRYLSYFGQPAERFQNSWNNLDTRCRGLADQLLRDANLDKLVADSWKIPPAFEAVTGDSEHPSAKRVYHNIVANHRRVSLVVSAEAWGDATSEESERVTSRNQNWPQALEITQRLNAGLISSWPQLPRQVREDAVWHLQRYRRSNLLGSWLLETTPLATIRPQSALLHVSALERTMPPTIEDFIRGLNVEENDRQTAARVLHRLTEAIGEFGYEGFIADVSSGEFLGGQDSPVGSNGINLIPSKDKGECCTVLLAVSKGADKRTALGFPKIMSQVKTHLIDCTDKTRVVIVLCDNWSPTTLDDHLDELRAHHRRGVRFLFLMAGTPGRAVAPVAVDLGVAP
jgi:hypothetical protein